MASPIPCIRRATDLGENYRKQCDDIVEAAFDVIDTDDVRMTFAMLRKTLWEYVFAPDYSQSAWNTHLPIIRPPIREEPEPKRLRVTVGFFKKDLPPSKRAQRQAKEKGCEPPRPYSARRRKAPACLQARYSREKRDVEWFWCDSQGKGADFAYTSLSRRAGREVMGVKADVVKHADFALQKHALRWNLNYGAYLMRLRLVRMLRDPGLKGCNRPSYAADADFSGFRKPPQPLKEVIRLTPSTGERAAIQELLAEAGPNAWEVKESDRGGNTVSIAVHPKS